MIMGKKKTLKQWSKDNSQLSQNLERKRIFWVFIALYISFTHKYIAPAIQQWTEILLVHPKGEIVFGALSNFLLFQYCDSNNGVFPIALHIIIVLLNFDSKSCHS